MLQFVLRQQFGEVRLVRRTLGINPVEPVRVVRRCAFLRWTSNQMSEPSANSITSSILPVPSLGNVRPSSTKHDSVRL